MMLSRAKVDAILDEFAFDGQVTRVEYPYGEGHINDTIMLEATNHTAQKTRYIVQKINKVVFTKPDEVMANIASVTSFLRDKIKTAGGDPDRETLSVVLTKLGGLYYIDEDEEYWRSYPFIENTVTLQQAESPEDLRNAALSFGRFMLLLQDYPVAELYETIPNFHNTPHRYGYFKEVLAADAVQRASTCPEEIAFVLSREADGSVLLDLNKAGKIPIRVTHNDTKLNNILLDANTGKGICIIDLDTVMPGVAAYDFGDAIRFGCSTALEDEADLDKVHFDITLYRTYAKAYLSEVAPIFSSEEIASLAWGARLLTLEQAMRFLTDYLAGDVYFKTHYSDHNLVRARNQIKLVQEMEAQWEAMQEALRD